MKNIITKLNELKLYPDSLMEFEPNMLSIDNHGGTYWITISNAGTTIQQILNALDIDYNNKPFLKNLIETFNQSEWGVTVNATGNIKSFYIGNDSAEHRIAIPQMAGSQTQTYIEESDNKLKSLFPIRAVYTSRTKKEYPNGDEFNDAFFGVGFYYDYENDVPITYKHYYDAYTRGVAHVYKRKQDGTVMFDEEHQSNDFSYFIDGLNITKEIGPHIIARSAKRSIEKDKSYLVIQTQKYQDGVV